MKPGGGRNKGAAFERWLVNQLKPLFPDAHRSAPMQAGHVAKYADLGGTGTFHIEAGHGKHMDGAKKLEQAITDALPGKLPIAITRRDRGRTVVTMDLEDWMILVGLYLARRND